MSNQFEILFSPLQMRAVTLPNRVIFGPHGTRLIHPGTGHSTEEQARYYAERAKGGAGLIIAGSCMVHPNGMAAVTNSIFDDSALPGLTRMTEMVHEHPSKIFVQLSHLGRQGSGSESELPLWAASPIACAAMREVPHEIDAAEIETLVNAYAEAAARAMKAGFDGMEVYMAHGYLLGGFLSPFSNKRTDEYGGSLENRMRLPLRIIDAVRSVVGEEVPVGIRLSADEFVKGGITPEMSQEIARILEDTGLIDFISVSQSNYATVHALIPEMSFPPGCFAYLTSAVREAVEGTPVIAVARINDPVQAENLLADGHADMIMMIRALIADPELPNKAKEGRLEEIRACIACNQGCIGRCERGLRMGCVQNPAIGYEKTRGIGSATPAPATKNVLVVGGGPAGLKVAEVAAMRGHRVQLFDRNDQLGGQVLTLAKAPSRDEFANCVRHLAAQLERLGVEVHLGTEVTPEMVASINADVVVTATGSYPQIPDLPGADGAHVFTPWQVLNGEVELGERVAVIDGGDNDAKFCSVADFIAQQGKQVEMITHLPSPGQFVENFNKFPTMQRLRSNAVTFIGYTLVTQIGDGWLMVCDPFTGEPRQIENVDSVVLAWYNEADNALYKALKSKLEVPLHAIGDCQAPRRVIDAVREGFLLGRQL